MKKLSELPIDTLLTIDRGYDLEVMSKEDYLDSSYFLDTTPKEQVNVTVAKVKAIVFRLYDCLETIGYDDTYDGWLDDVINSIDHSGIDVAGIEKSINEILKNYPIYWEGERVEIDMSPDLIGE